MGNCQLVLWLTRTGNILETFHTRYCRDDMIEIPHVNYKAHMGMGSILPRREITACASASDRGANYITGGRSAQGRPCASWVRLGFSVRFLRARPWLAGPPHPPSRVSTLKNLQTNVYRHSTCILEYALSLYFVSYKFSSSGCFRYVRC